MINERGEVIVVPRPKNNLILRIPRGFFSIEEISLKLGISVSTIYRYYSSGSFEGRKRVGNKYYYSLKAVKEKLTKFLESGVKKSIYYRKEK